MFWQINSPPAGSDQFATRQIEEVLYEYDGPRIFTCRIGGLLQLWYECAEDLASGAKRYLIVPTDVRTIEKLKTGYKTVHDALSQAWLWAVDFDSSEEVIGCWVLQGLVEVPQGSKPLPHVPLWPELEPLISYRLIGSGLSEGTVPASVVARAMERPTAALKRLLELVLNSGGTSQGGRPDEAFRKAYDLPAQRMAFNSFEVAFALPSAEQLQLNDGSESLYQSSAQLLLEGIQWLSDPEAHPEPSVQLLEVLKELAPPAHGSVLAAEIRGRLVPNQSVVRLSREDRSAVSRAINARKEALRRLEQVIGRIGEFDSDHFTLTLREVASLTGEVRCAFTEEQYDDLFEAFNKRVQVVGRMNSRNLFEIIAIEPLADALTVNPTAPAQLPNGDSSAE